MAALALPGVAQADNAPDKSSISLRYLNYSDSQANLDRISVHSPSVELEVPIAGVWSVRANMVADSISGASPRYHTAVSGASHFDERRIGEEVAVTRYFARSSITVSGGRSGENDYVSHFGAANASVSSEDNNTTWLFGLGAASDKINPVNLAVTDENRHTLEAMLGATQVLTKSDIIQVVLRHVRGRGYFSDPYKYVDKRPREHDQDTLLARWNHHVDGADATLRLAYRYYRDSYGIDAHTLTNEYVQALPGGWTLTPSLRLYRQTAAEFYFDPVYDKRFGPPFPPGYSFTSTAFTSADQRLSAFHALTWGLKVEKELGHDTSFDIKLEDYRQRATSPGLLDFKARSVQAGITFRW